jgi:hypothetical protein
METEIDAVTRIAMNVYSGSGGQELLYTLSAQ